MRKFIIYAILAITTASMAFMGFQCSSSELTTAKMAITSKDYPKAEGQLQKELSKNPKNEEAWFLLGKVRYETKNYAGMKDAMDKANEVGTKFKSDTRPYILQGWINSINEGVKVSNAAVDTADFVKAMELFKTAYYLVPDSLLSAVNLGTAYFKLGDYDNGEKYFREALNKHKFVEAARTLGRKYFDVAFDLKDKFIAQNKETMSTWNALQQFYEGMKSDNVLIDIKAPTSKTKPSDAKGGKGKSSKKSDAEEWNYPQYNLVLTIENELVTKITYSKPYMPAIDSTLARESQKNYGKAIDVLKEGYEINPTDPVITDLMINSFINSGRLKEAMVFIGERLKLDPENKMDHYFVGKFALIDKNFEEAEKSFQTALRIDPQFVDALLDLGNVYLEWGNFELEQAKKANKDLTVEKQYIERYKQAIPYLEKFVGQNPDNLRVWDALVQIYARTGDSKKGEEAMKKADSIRENLK
ncbi:MAG: tetratricopeptide repeat protein [Bacteroidota bacterium]